MYPAACTGSLTHGGALSERLTDQEIRALAGAFATSLSAVQLLERAGLDRLEQPSWAPAQAPLAFWAEVNNFLDSGGLPEWSAADSRRRRGALPGESGVRAGTGLRRHVGLVHRTRRSSDALHRARSGRRAVQSARHPGPACLAPGSARGCR
ncbi:effector-associated domain EAD1-containing protein [Frankia sp. Cr1]|uniref:effector-associated domain EAD1-containing protein n=1 Tax=Frankia sp. Cr1 TaxID=3073931 RepID=UPI002AD3E22F|nr:effector-associated domain EAD1-containing protein [Frankia sp. Cr1]